MSKKNNFDYDALKSKALSQFRSGKSLFGKDGAFGPLLKEFLEAAMVLKGSRLVMVLLS